MPIPPARDGADAADAVLELFGGVHDQLREEVRGLDAAALGWVPTAGANSIATIVRHLLGSEAETLRCVAGLPSERDRGAEFEGEGLTTEGVLELLDHADELLATVKPHIDPGRLDTRIALPTLPAGDVRSGWTWLVANYGHAREHLGHVQLTRQLLPVAT